MSRLVFHLVLLSILFCMMILILLTSSDINENSFQPTSIYPERTLFIRSKKETANSTNDEPSSKSNTIFETHNFTAVTDKPVLANGHVGYVPYSDSIYMNGLYNGYKGKSHRARIPNYANIYFEQCNGQQANNNLSCTFGLDIQHGVFQTQAEFNGGNFTVTQIQYAHRYYYTVIVNQISIKRNTVNHDGAFSVKLSRRIGTSSDDLNIHSIKRARVFGRGLFAVNASTLISEDPTYQKEPLNVYILYERIPREIGMHSGEVFKKFTWLTIIDYKDNKNLSIFDRVHNEHDNLLQLHIKEWKTFWDENSISAEGNDELTKSIQASLYAIASSLPSLNTYRQREPFFGLSPSGLGLGGPMMEGYLGHSFWDTETWMHPSILLLEPKWSHELLNYRYLVRETAHDNAQNTTYKGLRFPWESAYTGRDVTTDGYPEIIEFQQHVTADIAHAIRKHLFATYDTEWLLKGGCELALGTAQFWASRVSYNDTKQRYDIRGIMGPDEDHSNVTNNAYTNVAAALNLYLGDFSSCICHKIGYPADSQPTNWTEIASQIYLPYDSAQDYNPQFEGFTLNHIIKQADAVLLGYPLEYANIQKSTRKNNLNFYTRITRPNGPAMTWSMHAMGHLDIGGEPSIDLFNKTYIPYIRKPFYVWNEYMDGVKNGASNFITGAGGFLQLIMYGFAGIRLHADRLTIENPTLPPETNKLKLNGISYMRSKFSIEIQKDSYRVEIRMNGNQTRIFVDDNEEDTMKTIFVLNAKQKMAIKPKGFVPTLFETCPLPKDVINQPLN